MQEVGPILTALTVVAGLALGVERTLEVLKHIIDKAVGSLSRSRAVGLLDKTTAALDAAEKALESAREAPAPVASDTAGQTAAGSDALTSAPVIDVSAGEEVVEKFPAPQIPVIPITPGSEYDAAKVLFLQLAAAAIGIVLAQLFNLQLLTLLLAEDPGSLPAYFPVVDMLFTGIVIGGGSQPIHVLIRFITERKVTVETAPADQAANTPKKVGKAISTASLVEEQKEDLHVWKDIPYAGGIQPEKLDDVHKRPSDPDLVVYHHTAMSSASSFQDIVDEFLVNKKWRTGYHCVIMPNGAVRPFCRWDRYGNHAKGLNLKSLGIAFHGNFHIDADDRFSNADGRFGNQRPTEAQLHAGARVIALWVNLYDDIDLDFKEDILPHNKAIPGHTVCPGSNFPHKELENLVHHYVETWNDSAYAQSQLEEFKDPNRRFIHA